MDDNKRSLNEALYEQFARIGKALSSPRRLELIDLLAQGEWSVEELAGETGMSVANTSRHLQIMRRERLAVRRKEGTYTYYTLAGREVYRAWQAIRTLAEGQLAEIDRIVDRFLPDRNPEDAVTAEELHARLDEKTLLVIDVRPEDEYRAGRIPGARSLPVSELENRLSELPQDHPIVVYSRGPYCPFADEAVEILRGAGRHVRRLAGGLPDWLAGGRPGAHGS